MVSKGLVLYMFGFSFGAGCRQVQRQCHPVHAHIASPGARTIAERHRQHAGKNIANEDVTLGWRMVIST